MVEVFQVSGHAIMLFYQIAHTVGGCEFITISIIVQILIASYTGNDSIASIEVHCLGGPE